MNALSVITIAAAAAAIAAPALAAPCGCPPKHRVAYHHPIVRRAVHRTAVRTVVRTVVVTRYVRVPVRYEAPPPPPPRFEGPPPPPAPFYDREPVRFEHHRPPCRHGEFRHGGFHRGDWRGHDGGPRHEWNRVVYRY